MRGRTAYRTVALAAVLAGGLAWEASAQQGSGPTDAEIAHIAVTANAIDAELGELAKERSRNAEVQRFAETMIRDHKSVIEQATQLVQELGVTPKEHEVSRSLRSAADEAKKKLSGLSGAAFDRAYMQREVEYHQAVIDAVKTVLIPNAKNAQLKALLEKVSPVLEGHLRHAKDVAAKLGG